MTEPAGVNPNDDSGDRLFVAVLGNRNSGKSTTWNTLFGSRVRTGTKSSRPLRLASDACVDVFLVSGSFEERGLYAGEVLDDKECRVVLCSIQYTEEVSATLDYVKERGFELFVQWLNPGYSDAGEVWDRLGLVNKLLSDGALFSIRDGQADAISRVQEIRQLIHGWALHRGLVYAC